MSRLVAAHWPHFMNAGPSLSSVFLQMQTCPLWEMPKHCLLQRSAWEPGQPVLTRTCLFAGGSAGVQADTNSKSTSITLQYQAGRHQS